jgi:hypothetical protein
MRAPLTICPTTCVLAGIRSVRLRAFGVDDVVYFGGDAASRRRLRTVVDDA